MRVAVCIRGAVSRASGKIHSPVDLSGGPFVDWRACAGSIFRHVLGANREATFDIFLQGWNVELASEMVDVFAPKAYSFVSNSREMPRIQRMVAVSRLNRTGVFDQQRPRVVDAIRGAGALMVEPHLGRDVSGLSQALSFQLVFDLVERHLEQTQNTPYDLVMFMRPDVLYVKNIDLSNYREDSAACNFHAAVGTSTAAGDLHFIMGYSIARKFSKLFDYPLIGGIHETHGWIPRYFSDIIGVSLEADDMHLGRDLEVARKIVPSHPNFAKFAATGYAWTPESATNRKSRLLHERLNRRARLAIARRSLGKSWQA